MEFRKCYLTIPRRRSAIRLSFRVLPVMTGIPETLNAVFVRADFYNWFNTEILSDSGMKPFK